MKKKTLGILTVLLVLLSTATAQAYVVNSWGSSWVEDLNDGRPDWIVHLCESTPYNNGYAHGVMLAPWIQETTRAYLQWAADNGCAKADALAIWAQHDPYILQEFKDELSGLAAGSGVALDDLKAVHALPSRFHCCGFAVKPAATATGQTYQARSLDYSINITDPISGRKIQENGIVLIRHGEGTAHPVWCGFVGSVGGTRVGAVTVGEQGSGCSGEIYAGNPMVFQVRQAVRAANAQDAAVVLCTDRTAGFNFETSDAAGNVRAVEVAGPNAYYIGDENGQEYSPSHFWYIPASPAQPNIVRRTNHFISSQCKPFQGDNEGSEAHMYDLSELEIDPRNGTYNLQLVMDTLTNTYNSNGAWLFDITTEHQWAISTTTGEMMLARASRDASAYDMPKYYYNLASELAETLPSHYLRIPTYPWGTPTWFNYKGGYVYCHALANCNQGHAISYWWEARRNGTLQNDSSWVNRTTPDARWTAPKNSTLFDDRFYTVSCRMTCSGGETFTGQFTVRVDSIL